MTHSHAFARLKTAGVALVTFALATAAPPPLATSRKAPSGPPASTTLAVLNVLAPKNGDYWDCGESEAIYWNRNELAGKRINIYLYKGNTLSQKIAVNLNIEAEVYSWKVPETQPIGNDYRILLESVDNPAVRNYSPGYFTIRKLQSEIKMLAPNGGETWVRGKTHNIGWAFVGKPGTTVKITLEKPGAAPLVIKEHWNISENFNLGMYPWPLPSSLETGNGYKIRVQVENTTLSDTSDQAFTIQ